MSATIIAEGTDGCKRLETVGGRNEGVGLSRRDEKIDDRSLSPYILPV